MANYRPFFCNEWEDDRVQNLKPHGKLLYGIMRTNKALSESGLFKMTHKTIKHLTGLNKTQLLNALNDNINNGLMMYDEENKVLWLIHFFKFNPKSPNMIKAVINDLKILKTPLKDSFLIRHGESLNLNIKKMSLNIALFKAPSISPLLPIPKPIIKPIPISCEEKEKPDPRIKKIIDYFYKKHLEIHKRKVVINGGKDGSIIKMLLKTLSEDEIKEKIDLFMVFDNQWVKDAGYSVGVFKSQINKLKPKKPMSF